ncbi:tyrosine-type recombinase/integrase [Streptomyces sp. PTD5-9]|uniref:tyrosine-type recombinase/integrase n=1 Tax=Streptomyces sp. PTD5-9 TaxID=3120150 RepID=UPI00300AFE1D
MADRESGVVVSRSDMKLGDWMDKWFDGLRVEDTTKAGYEPKIRLHIKPHLGAKKVKDVTDDDLDSLYRTLETAPCPSNKGKPLGAKSVRHVHNILSGAFDAAVAKRLIPANPASTANPPTIRQIKAQERKYVTLDDADTARFLEEIWTPCGRRGCGPLHFCTRDAPLWTTYTATGVRRSEALGMMWHLVHWDDCAIELEWVVVEVGNKSVLRRLTKDGDDNAIIYVDQALMNVLKTQWERQEMWKERLAPLWDDHDLIFARDGYLLRKDGITVAQYGKRRVAGARKLASGTAQRIGLGRIG